MTLVGTTVKNMVREYKYEGRVLWDSNCSAVPVHGNYLRIIIHSLTHP